MKPTDRPLSPRPVPLSDPSVRRDSWAGAREDSDMMRLPPCASGARRLAISKSGQSSCAMAKGSKSLFPQCPALYDRSVDLIAKAAVEAQALNSRDCIFP